MAIVQESFELLPSTVCEASENWNIFIADLTAGMMGMEQLSEHAFSGNLAAATLLCVGSALVLAPIIFGREWLSPVLTLLALLLGAIGAHVLVGDTRHQGLLLNVWVDDLPMCVWPCVGGRIASGEMSCGALLGIQLVLSCIVAAFVNRHLEVAFFAVGAAGCGLACFLSLGLIHDLSTQMPRELCVWPCIEGTFGRGVSSDFEDNAMLVRHP